jgi:hypothetical protein
MKKTIVLAFSIMLSAFVINANAQKGLSKLSLNYSYSLPTGSFKSDIISNGSPRGANGEFLFGISRQWSAGLMFGYQDYYQKYQRDLYQTGDHEVTSAVLSNSVQVMPLVAKGTFYPLAHKSAVLPYISLGAGVSFVNFHQYLGEFGSSNSAVSFTGQAGAGIHVPFGKYSLAGLNLGADYNFVQYKKSGYNGLNNLSFKAGLYFPFH